MFVFNQSSCRVVFGAGLCSYSTNHLVELCLVQAFEEDDGKEYVYKEPKITGLTEICERLKDLYTAKFGKGCVQLIMDSTQVGGPTVDTGGDWTLEVILEGTLDSLMASCQNNIYY